MATVFTTEPAVFNTFNIDDLDVDLDGLQVLAQVYGYDAGGDNWDRLRSTAAGGLVVDLGANNNVQIDELPPVAAMADGVANASLTKIGTFPSVWNGATWDRAPGSAADGLLVNLGGNNDIDTELPAAVASDDDMANPTAPAVLAAQVLYNPYTGGWERARAISGSQVLAGATTGHQAVGQTDGKVTYRLAFRDLAALGGLAVRLAGNDTTVTRVTKVQIAKPSVAQAPLRMVKTSTAAHGGTYTAPVPIPLDSADAASASAVRMYTALPADGDVNIAQVWQVDASGAPDFVDETADANDVGNADWLIYIAGEEIGDYVAIGYTEQFSEVIFDNLNGVQGVGGVVVWEYWDGDSWEALAGVTDGTVGFTAAVADGQSLTFTIPADWESQVLNGSADLFYIRARITTVYGVNPVYDQGFIAAAAAEVGTGSVYESDIGVGDVLFETYGSEQNTQALTLRSPAETFEIRLSAAATLNGYIEYTEE